MSEIINIMGLFGSILVSVSFIPQTYKTLKSEDSSDISYIFMGLNIISASMMCVYGVYFNVIPVIISNGSVLINCIIILLYIGCYKEQTKSTINYN